MHVPVFNTRHVFVNVVPPMISVLSGMVKSITNEALFVQSGALIGLDGGVEVRVASGAEVKVADISVAAGASVAVAPVMGISNVSAGVGIVVSSGALALHPTTSMDISSMMNVITSFPCMSTSFH